MRSQLAYNNNNLFESHCVTYFTRSNDIVFQLGHVVNELSDVQVNPSQTRLYTCADCLYNDDMNEKK